MGPKDCPATQAAKASVGPAGEPAKVASLMLDQCLIALFHVKPDSPGKISHQGNGGYQGKPAGSLKRVGADEPPHGQAGGEESVVLRVPGEANNQPGGDGSNPSTMLDGVQAQGEAGDEKEREELVGQADAGEKNLTRVDRQQESGHQSSPFARPISHDQVANRN